MIVRHLRHRCGEGVCELCATVRSEAWSREEFTLWYRVPSTHVADHTADDPDASPFVAGLLPWALRRAESLVVEGHASPQLLDTVPRLSDVFKAFWPDLMTPVEVTAGRRAVAPAEPSAAAFFTRGVDSWYTARTYGERAYDVPPLQHLLYVPSVDLMFDEEHRQRCVRATKTAAADAGYVPLVAETNL